MNAGVSRSGSMVTNTTRTSGRCRPPEPARRWWLGRRPGSGCSQRTPRSDDPGARRDRTAYRRRPERPAAARPDPRGRRASGRGRDVCVAGVSAGVVTGAAVTGAAVAGVTVAGAADVGATEAGAGIGAAEAGAAGVVGVAVGARVRPGALPTHPVVTAAMTSSAKAVDRVREPIRTTIHPLHARPEGARTASRKGYRGGCAGSSGRQGRSAPGDVPKVTGHTPSDGQRPGATPA